MGGTVEPRLSFVIATRNRSAVLADALASIDAQDLSADLTEIIVADDGSTDDTRAVVERFAAQSRFSTRCTAVEGRGVNAARNAGIRSARGEIVAFIDDDELVPAKYGQRLLDLLDAHPEAGAFGGPLVMHPDHLGPRQCARCRGREHLVPAMQDGAVLGLVGGNMAIRRSALETAGVFDSTLSGRGDETEWFHRAQACAIPFVADDQLLVWHRRDHLRFRALLEKAYRDGANLPSYQERVGDEHHARPALVARYGAHAATHLCTHGLVLASSEFGHLVGERRLRRRMTR